MATPQNIELEAAKFLHKLIQESKDEPTKLATKLYVILQHMRTSGKENSMPYQVISRAMETVINQHNIDIETLVSSRVPQASGAENGDSTSSQLAGTSQRFGVAEDSRSNFAGNEMGTPESYGSTRVQAGSGSGGYDMYHGSTAHNSGGAIKVQGVPAGVPSSYMSAESATQPQYGSPTFDSHSFAAKVSKDRSTMEALSVTPLGDQSAGNGMGGKTLNQSGSNMGNLPNKGIVTSSAPETNMLRSTASRDTGKSPVSQGTGARLPFMEQQLKQLRAQCLVFLSFRNGMAPKKLHLEIALGNVYTKEDGPRRDLIDQKGKDQFVRESLDRADSSSRGDAISTAKEADNVKIPVQVKNEQDKNFLFTRKHNDGGLSIQEAMELHSSTHRETHGTSAREILYHDGDGDNSRRPKNSLCSYGHI